MSAHARSAAVVIGIDRYADPAIDDLRGAVADARAINRLLIEHFGFDPDRVKTLYDQRATAERIGDVLEWLTGAVGPDGAAVFYFAGHGAQRFDDSGDEADAFDETFVPSDSGRGSRPDLDLTDDWLRTRLERLVARAGSVTAIFDCCHSGTMGREIGEQVAVRGAPPVRAARSVRKPGLRRARAALPYTLLAASAAGQRAHESGSGDQRQGVFTRALVTALEASTADDSWRTVMSRVAAEVRAKQSGQDPQLEGIGRDRRPFSDALPASRWALAEPDGEAMRVALGRLHGVEVDDVLELLPLKATGSDESPQKARVVDAGPLSCRCVPLDGRRPSGPRKALPPPGRPSLWNLAFDPAFATDPFDLIFDAPDHPLDGDAHEVYAGSPIELLVSNNGGSRLHLALVMLNAEGYVHVVLPEPGGEVQLGPFSEHTEVFDAELGIGWPRGQRWRLVLIASTEPFDPRPLAGSARTLSVPPIKNLLLALYPLVVRVVP